MNAHYRQGNLNPDFPFNAYEFEIYGDKDFIHWHNYLQIALCIKGQGKFLFGSKEYSVKEGDVFIVDNFENHVAIADFETNIYFLFVIFLPDLIAAPGSRMLDYEYLSPFWYDSKNFCNKIDRSSATAKTVAPIIYELRSIWDNKPVGYKHLVDANLKRILSILINHYEISNNSQSFTKIHSHIKIQPALNYINQHFTENITLEDAAETIHMSESRFRHLFKEITNIGFKEYINYLRINEAKKLLLGTELGLNEIVEKVGFSGAYQFYKKFFIHVSMTPNEYRKYFRDNVVTSVISKNGFMENEEMQGEKNKNNYIIQA